MGKVVFPPGAADSMTPEKQSETAQIARLWAKSKAIDVVLGDHAVSQGAARYFGGNAATVRYCRDLFSELPAAVLDKILGWKGFPNQPPAERSIYLRDIRHFVSLPLLVKRQDHKLVIPTIIVKQDDQPIIPCGGVSRMSLILDWDGVRAVSKLRVGRLFYADTPENRETPYKSPAELSGK